MKFIILVLSTILLSLGFNAVYSFMLLGAEPGEVVLDNTIEKKVEAMLVKLLNKGYIDNSISPIFKRQD